MDNSTHSIPQRVSSNVKHNPSLLHYTSTEGCPFHHSSPLYSDNIIVHEHFYEGNVSRELEYKPHWLSIREGDVVVGMNSNAHPRLNSFKLRSILKINNSTKLCKFSFKCSNLVNYLTINNVCKPLTK